MVVTHQPIQLSFFIADIDTVLTTYDSVRWWRSRTGQSGLFEPATFTIVKPAVLEGSKVGPFQLHGKTLSIRVNGVTQVDIPFTDPDPVTITQVLAAITGATGLVVPSNDGGKLVLTTVTTGSVSSIEILVSEAAPFLGFDTDAAALGLDADTLLVVGVHEYFFLDQNSSPEFWYRAELRDDLTFQTAGLGVAFQAGPEHIADDLLITAFIRLNDLRGQPIQGREVTFVNALLPNVVTSGSTRYGIFRRALTMSTDKNGYAEIRLLRGMKIDISVDGTDFIRRLQIPSTGDSVDLLDPALVSEDEFGIQQPDIDFAVRTS